METQELKLKEYQEIQKRLQQHHSIQMKRDKKKEEERKKKEWVDLERQKTLERLKSFKDKKNSPVVLKSLRVHPRLQSRSENINPSRVTRTIRGVPADIPCQIFVQKSNVAQEIPSNDTSNPGTHLPSPPTLPLLVPPCQPPPPPPLPGLPSPPPPPPPLPQGSVLFSVPAPQPRSVVTLNPKKPELMEVENSGNRKTVPNQLGAMEEVLASLKRGESLLRRVDQPQTPTGVRDSILTAIRQGVKLRKVQKETVYKDPENELERNIKAAMQRMKKASADSDDDDDDDDESSEYKSGDWDA